MANLKSAKLWVAFHPGKFDFLADICFESSLAELRSFDWSDLQGV